MIFIYVAVLFVCVLYSGTINITSTVQIVLHRSGQSKKYALYLMYILQIIIGFVSTTLVFKCFVAVVVVVCRVIISKMCSKYLFC